jgi:hypothetical protein
VFFSFHYEDVKSFRANVVRNSDVIRRIDNDIVFYDSSLWEEVKKEGDIAIKRMINKGLENTSITAVLIGTHTYSRRWVKYELIKSFEKGNGLLGIHINSIPDKNQMTAKKGPNPFDYLGFRINDYKNVIELLEFNTNTRTWDTYKELASIPLSSCKYNLKGQKAGKFSSLFPVYDWVSDRGYQNISFWLERAAKEANR